MTPRAFLWCRALLGAALLAAAAWAWMQGTASPGLAAAVPGANLFVSGGAHDRLDISANNSPELVRNPRDATNLVVVNRIDLPRYSCALHASYDGGRSWQETRVPFPSGEEDPPRCYAPDVAYAPDGTLHMSFVTLKGLGNVPEAVWAVSSNDGGRSLGIPVKASGPFAFQVRLSGDPGHADRLYLSWLQADGTGNLSFQNTGNPVVTSISNDAGATWSAPVRVSSPGRARVVAPSPAVGPHGELYVLFVDLLDDRLDYAGAHEGRGGDPYDGPWALVLARSGDHGASWEETVVDGGVVPSQRFVVFLPPTPALAVDAGTGRLYVAFTDGRLGDPDVALWTSSDGGRSFGPLIRVNDTPVRDRTAQYMPQLQIAPRGRIDILYFDRRADVANVNNEVSLQSSYDLGRTFTRRVRVSDRSFDSRVGPGSDRNLTDLGSRLALSTNANEALAVWPDTRAGSQANLKQDLASAVVFVPDHPASPRRRLQVLGGVAAALGLGLLLTERPRRAQARRY